MIIPVGRTAVVKDLEMAGLEEWGHVIYFIHHFELGKYLLYDEEGLRVYYPGQDHIWGDAYYELVEE